MALEHGDAVDGLPEVPQAEGGVLAAGHDQPGGGVTRGPGQLHVVPRQRLDHGLAAHVPQGGRPVPAGRHTLVSPGQPVGGHNHSGVAGQHHQCLTRCPATGVIVVAASAAIIGAVSALRVAVLAGDVGRGRAPHVRRHVPAGGDDQLLTRVEL